MRKFSLFLILLLNIQLISSANNYPVYCVNEQRDDCSDGSATASIDNIGNVPDACCQVFIYELFCDGTYGCDQDHEDYCLQIKKDSAKDYLDYILYETNLDPDEVRITCKGEVVLKWSPSSSSADISSIKLCILILLLLF